MPTTPVLGLPYPESTDTADVPRDMRALAEAIDPLGVVPIGAMMLWPKDTAPSENWMLMQGQSVPAGVYPELAIVLGSSAGSVLIPDMRNRFPVGAGDVALLQPAGANTKKIQLTELPAHAHAVTDPGHTHTTDVQGAHGHNISVGGAAIIDPNQFGVPYSGGWVPSWGWAGSDSVARGVFAQATTSIVGVTSGIHTHTASADAQGNHAHNALNHASNVTTQNNGGGGDFDNRPGCVAVNYIIRVL